MHRIEQDGVELPDVRCGNAPRPALESGRGPPVSAGFPRISGFSTDVARASRASFQFSSFHYFEFLKRDPIGLFERGVRPSVRMFLIVILGYPRVVHDKWPRFQQPLPSKVV